VANDTIYVAVDAGNGFTNAVSGKLKGRITKTSFPSVRADAPDRSLGLGSDQEVQYTIIKWFGHRYTYGSDTVRLSANAIERHHGRERYGDKFHGMLVALSLVRMKIKSGAKINLTLFMPPGLCTTDHKKHVVKSFSEGLEITVDGKEYSWDFTKIEVRPEGLGAVLAFMLSPTGKPLTHDIFDGDVLILDSGTYTLDVLLTTGGNFDPASLATATWDNDGLFRHIIIPLLAAIKAYDEDFWVVTPDMVDRAIYDSHHNGGKCVITSAGKEMDLTEALQIASARYASWITNNIFDSHYRGLLGIKSLLIVGGGAHLIMPHLYKDPLIGGKVFNYSQLPQLKHVRPTEFNAVGGQRWSRFQAQSN